MAERISQDRLAFLIALVAYLPDGDPVPVAEIAAHFGVDPEDVRGSVRLIAVSGVPGETAGYLHGDLFDIDWDALDEHDEVVLTNRVAIDDAPRLSAREAAALIAGLQTLGHLPELAGSEALAGLVAKLARGASGAPSAVAVNAGAASPALTSLATAIASGRVVSFDYRAADGRRQRRTVDPLRIESIDADAYLRGWCHLRDAVRTFRIDRIAQLAVLEEPATHSAADIDLPEGVFSGADVDAEVTVAFDAGGVALIADYAPRSLRIDEATGRATAVVAVAHPAIAWRLVAELPDAVVLAPPSAREAVALRAADALGRYRRTPGGSGAFG